MNIPKEMINVRLPPNEATLSAVAVQVSLSLNHHILLYLLKLYFL
jgi:hypothetical protein